MRLGYVGRVTPEKNVRFLRELEIGLRAAHAPPVRFLIVGDGSDREWLSQNLAAADRFADLGPQLRRRLGQESYALMRDHMTELRFIAAAKVLEDAGSSNRVVA